MEPVFYPGAFLALFFAEASFALGNLVCVMNRNMVDTACVDIDVFAEVFHAHGRTFDMPAGIAPAPGRVPGHGLILKF